MLIKIHNTRLLNENIKTVNVLNREFKMYKLKTYLIKELSQGTDEMHRTSEIQESGTSLYCKI